MSPLIPAAEIRQQQEVKLISNPSNNRANHDNLSEPTILEILCRLLSSSVVLEQQGTIQSVWPIIKFSFGSSEKKVRNQYRICT